MDPLSAMSSLAGICQCIVQIISFSKKFRDAPNEAQITLEEIEKQLRSIDRTLLQLDGVVRQMPNQSNLEFDIGELRALMEQCHQGLRECVEDLKHKPPSSVGKLVKRLEFILKEDKYQSLIDMVYRYKQDIILAFTLKHSEGQDLAKKQDEERLRINVVNWFKGTDAGAVYAKTRETHQKGTGSWFLEGEIFENFKAQAGQRLWLRGIPGCGKTILSGSIIQYIETLLSLQQFSTSGLGYFFFSYTDTAKQTTEGMLSTIAVQLCERLSAIPQDIIHLYRQNTAQLTRPILLKALIILAKAFTRIYLVIDAMDEVSPSERNALITTLHTITTNASLANVNLIVTSRPEPYLESLNEYITEAVCLTSSVVDPDIRSFLIEKLEQEPKFSKWNPDLKTNVTEKLIGGAHGMFRWVDCQIHELRKCLRPIDIRRVLSSLPPTLEETYKRILLQISEESRFLLARLLIWVTFSPKPLRIEALAEAIVFEFDAEDIDPEMRFSDPEDILQIPGASLLLANETHRVTLTHYSVKEYLISDRFQRDPDLMPWRILMQDPYNYLARVCIGYLSRPSIIQFSDAPVSLQGTNSSEGVFYFTRTAQREWNWYIKQCQGEERQKLEVLLSDMLYASEEVWQNFRLSDSGQPDYRCNILLLMIRFGFHTAVQLGMERHPDSIQTVLDQALTVAVKQRDADMIRMLVSKGAKSVEGLDYAIRQGDTDLIKIIVANGVGSRQAVAYAIRKGDTDLTKWLLKQGACLSEALKYAVFSRDTELVKKLADNGVQSVAALEYAVREDNFDLILTLLTNGARSPVALRFALGRRNFELINLLVDSGIYSQEALDCAVELRDRPLIYKLVSNGAHTSTALLYAAEVSDTDLVHKLLWNGADYATAFNVAISHNDLELMVKLAAQGGESSYALDHAIRQGYKELILMLVANGASSEKALQYAVDSGDDELVDLLYTVNVIVD